MLAAGPGVPAERLAGLTVGTRVRARAVYRTLNGTKPADWEAAPDIVGGVGLLATAGRLVTDWGPEKARDGFTTERHPRTVIGTAGDGRIWLITVDGRNKALSLGMSFAELQALVTRVGLVHALNLDGGGSTTMVVKGAVVNHPSDPTGPRRVSDASLSGRGRRREDRHGQRPSGERASLHRARAPHRARVAVPGRNRPGRPRTRAGTKSTATRLFALVSDYEPKPLSEGRWEAHRRYLDLQYVVVGRRAHGRRADRPPRGRRVRRGSRHRSGSTGAGDFLTLGAGQFMILWPGDAHMPGLDAGVPGPVRKVVVKIAIE